MKRFITILFIIVSAFSGKAQDIHYSQFYASPVTLNPALTGFILGGSYRFGANYRAQWFSVTPNFWKTYSAYGDYNYILNRRGDILGLGGVLVGDNAGDGALRTTKVMPALAIHKSLNRRNSAYLSLGVSGGLVQKSVDFSKLTFDAQWMDDIGFDPAQYNGEPGANGTLNYLDLNAGLYWFYAPSKSVNFHGGYSMFHITQPRETFYNYSDTNRVGQRHVITGGIKTILNRKAEFLPGMIFMTQNKVYDVVLGANIGYRLKKSAGSFSPFDDDSKNIFYVGGWYRMSDAIILLAGLKLGKNINAGFSYDFNLSKLTPASWGQGGAEFSITYRAKIHGRGYNRKRNVGCPNLF